MTKAQKIEIVSELTEAFKSTQAVAMCGYANIAVQDIEGFRKTVKAIDGGQVRIANNKLSMIAFKNAGIDGVNLKGTTLLAWGNDPIAVAKACANFSKETEGNLEIKSGYFDQAIVEKSHVEALSKLPGRNELLGMLLSVWTAPLRGMVTGLDNLAKSKEEA